MKQVNNNPNPLSSRSQAARIANYLLEGHRITPIEALEMFGSFRLGARIADVERLTGIRPQRRLVEVTNRQGKVVRVAQYWLK